jgi:DNA-binding XRE family transcriptional regulator
MDRKTRANRGKKAKPNNVKRLRISLGMFQNDLAKAADISVASVRGMESLSRDLSATLRARLVHALGKESQARGQGALTAKDVFPNDPDL